MTQILSSLLQEINSATEASLVEGEQGEEGPRAYYLQREAGRTRLLQP